MVYVSSVISAAGDVRVWLSFDHSTSKVFYTRMRREGVDKLDINLGNTNSSEGVSMKYQHVPRILKARI